ncbi:hypothetical protein CRV15_30855 (plasmid) [Streptomyces clavuligerus]|nr:hypothetical protein CRV15_30855 [Streptomyces clavuligerus]
MPPGRGKRGAPGRAPGADGAGGRRRPRRPGARTEVSERSAPDLGGLGGHRVPVTGCSPSAQRVLNRAGARGGGAAAACRGGRWRRRYTGPPRPGRPRDQGRLSRTCTYTSRTAADRGRPDGGPGRGR